MLKRKSRSSPKTDEYVIQLKKNADMAIKKQKYEDFIERKKKTEPYFEQGNKRTNSIKAQNIRAKVELNTQESKYKKAKSRRTNL